MCRSAIRFRLTPAQEALAGKQLAKLLRSRVAYHHSGLSYGVRAGLIEPLAKSGQLNVVVATTGLAAGINFSMRSVLVTDRRYYANNFERQVEADELLQMFGRAGRRGLDDAGYVLYSSEFPRLGDARPLQLKRAAPVDWPSLLSVMNAAARRGEAPFGAAAEVAKSLFSSNRVSLGVEYSLETGPRACGLWVTDERARFVRRGVVEMLNFRGEWEPQPVVTSSTLGDAWVREQDQWRHALVVPRILDGLGQGNLCRLLDRGIYGREMAVATLQEDGKLLIAKSLRKTAGYKMVDRALFERDVLPVFAGVVRPGLICGEIVRGATVSLRIDFSKTPIDAYVDSSGAALVSPPTRENIPSVCATCDQLEHDRTVPIAGSPAWAWRQLGLIEADGVPTQRGIIFSFFHGGEGLAIAVALEDDTYDLESLVFDLANVRAGPRFAGEDAPLGGRLGILCQRIYKRLDFPGYLSMGVPPQYGSGASEVVREIVTSPGSRYKLISDVLRHGDIERALMEWRSLLRHIVAAPDFNLARWRDLKVLAEKYAESTKSPALIDLPPLLASQQQRRLI